MTLMLRAVGLASCLLCGCASFYLHRAPRSAGEAWTLPPDASRPVRPRHGPPIEPDHVYTLPELIDIAESANPDTRIGWERARQAALAVGIAIADYFPSVSAVTLVGYQHVFFPVPTLPQSTIGINPFEVLPSVSFPIPPIAQQSGHIGVDTFQVLPFLFLRWPVFVLGRGASVKAAENLSVAANALFTAEHQKIMFEVAIAYFRLNAARALVAVSRDALEHTRAIAKAADARYAQGIATVVEVSEAKREVAQSEYNLTQAEAAEVIVYATLVSALGIDPVAHLDVAPNPIRELPKRIEHEVAAYVESALATRADLRAARARLPSTEAAISRSKAAYAPRVTLVGTAGAAVLGAHIGGQSLPTVTLPNLTAGATFEWLLFDGGVRDIQSEIARSQHNEAAQQLIKLEHEAVQQVTTAYNEVNANFSRFRAASALSSTATIAEDAVTKSYLNGLATLTDAMNAQKARSLASGAREQAFADALIAAATLAFASGALTSANALPYVER